MLRQGIRPIAHVYKKPDGTFEEQDLFSHLNGVADFARQFADEFGAGDWAALMGWLHDVGKFTDGWQAALRREVGYDLDAFVEVWDGKGNHSTLGAIVFNNNGQFERYQKILAYAITGHHAGLPDWEPAGKGACIQDRLFRGNTNVGIDRELIDLLNAIKKDDATRDYLSSLKPPSSPPMSYRRTPQNPRIKAEGALHIWIRMLFSCVVDADYLDTERFMDRRKFEKRGRYSTLADLKKRLDSHMAEKSSKAAPSPLNDLRAAILAACRKKALSLKPGFFTLSVPTGAGKTLASMAFAIDHAIEYDKKRVIVAIPYTSIIEQTAKVYKFGTDMQDEIASGATLFGEENVIEHHSNIDPEKETQENRLATENWDAPIIVTTNVQLFESLAASRPSKCRKLHNIANSVIILDEAQLLPTPYLRSVLASLEHLVEYFGVTVLLCTATQPALKGRIGDGVAAFDGLESNIEEIYDGDREKLFKSFRRVEFRLPANGEKYGEWQELAQELSTLERVLCVVNTRKSARDLYALMPKGSFHLSGLMCPEDRSDVITNIKKLLKSNESVRLISTQLVEAGVDIDFPTVYRAFAGIDSIIQSAGRCNREGHMVCPGKVVVFNPPASSPSGLLRKGEEAAKAILKGRSSLELSDGLFCEYFKEFFGRVNDFDKPKACTMMLKNDSSLMYQFRDYAGKYHLIDDEEQMPVLVPYVSELTGQNGAALIAELENRADYGIIRKLQRFTVSVPKNVFREMSGKGMLRLAGDGKYATISDPGFYKPGVGLECDNAALGEALLF